MPFAAAVLFLLVAAAAVYRVRTLAAKDAFDGTRAAALWSGILIAGAAFSVWSAVLDAPALSYERAPAPVALAIAFDLSPSMLALPDPAFAPGDMPRFERGKAVLLELMRTFEERERPLLVSLVGFTRQADTLMGWNQSAAQAGEAMRYTLAPDLFGSSGTSLEAAVAAVGEAFERLPAAYADARRFAIIVSDGEDTMREASFGYALALLAEGDYGVVALQTGSLASEEGIPLYNRVGEFTGFRRMGGRLYTRPDVDAMHAIAESPPSSGIYVRAESPTAVERISDFMLDAGRRGQRFDAAILPGLGMFGAVFLLCLRVFQ